MIDVRDSMGANTINTVLEGLSKKMLSLLNGDHLMSIMSNLSPERVCKSSFKIPVTCLHTGNLTGLEVAQRIVQANDIAKHNIFRASTHNKGIMNGVIALCLALGQDTRAIEASCHSFSVYKYGKYRCLTNYYLTDDKKFLIGEIELPF